MTRSNHHTLRAIIFLALSVVAVPLMAQSSAPPADFMRSIGKIYVVVGVIILVFLGLVAWLWILDRRLTKLEYQIKPDVEG